jgi:hypothetical protein
VLICLIGQVGLVRHVQVEDAHQRLKICLVICVRLALNRKSQT